MVSLRHKFFSICSCNATRQLQIRLPGGSPLSYKGPLHKSPTPHPGSRKTQESAGDRKGGGATVVGGSGADGRCWQHIGSWWIGGFILQYEYRHKCLIFPHLLPQLERVGLRPSAARLMYGWGVSRQVVLETAGAGKPKAAASTASTTTMKEACVLLEVRRPYLGPRVGDLIRSLAGGSSCPGFWTGSRSSAGVVPKRRECPGETGHFSYEPGLDTRRVY